MDTTLRTKEVQKQYESYLKTPEAKDCCFCREIKAHKEKEDNVVIVKWNYWCLMKNNYPYDKVYKKHDLLFPLRHVDWGDLTVKEISEYNRIMNNLRDGYHQFLENFGERQSQKGHYHVHLCVFKD